MDVIEAIQTRRSARAFLPTPVAKETAIEILNLAARAPSGTNMQPWKVYVAAGAVREALTKETLEAIATKAEVYKSEFKYYPDEWAEPYKSRRKKVGLDLYGLLGLAKENKEGMRKQQWRNYEFFGAPIGLFFAIDKQLEIGSWFDCGMFVGNVMLVARAKGLHSCPQASWPPFHRIIRKHLPIPISETIMCGMSLGYVDKVAPENQLKTERAPASEFAEFFGF